MEKGIYELKIGKDFRNLIQLPARNSLRKLQLSLLKDGCLEPILIWRGYIVDGHNRYAICTKHGIPFAVKEKSFSSREEALVWICVHQLCRQDLTEEYRKYLIGMEFEAERAVYVQKRAMANVELNTADLDSLEFLDRTYPEDAMPSERSTALHIAEVQHVALSTVIKYAEYARDIERIRKKTPEIAQLILNGNYKFSHNNLAKLARMTAEEITEVIKELDNGREEIARYKNTREQLQARKDNVEERAAPNPSVKDMPAYDPDAEITALTLTVPSWTDSISRARSKTEMKKATVSAKQKLKMVLDALREAVSGMLAALEEE